MCIVRKYCLAVWCFLGTVQKRIQSGGDSKHLLPPSRWLETHLKTPPGVPQPPPLIHVSPSESQPSKPPVPSKPKTSRKKRPPAAVAAATPVATMADTAVPVSSLPPAVAVGGVDPSRSVASMLPSTQPTTTEVDTPALNVTSQTSTGPPMPTTAVGRAVSALLMASPLKIKKVAAPKKKVVRPAASQPTDVSSSAGGAQSSTSQLGSVSDAAMNATSANQMAASEGGSKDGVSKEKQTGTCTDIAAGSEDVSTQAVVSKKAGKPRAPREANYVPQVIRRLMTKMVNQVDAQLRREKALAAGASVKNARKRSEYTTYLFLNP